MSSFAAAQRRAFSRAAGGRVERDERRHGKLAVDRAQVRDAPAASCCKAWLGWPGDREICPAYDGLFRFLVRNTGTYVATVTSMSPVILDDDARHTTAFSASWCGIREPTLRLLPQCRLLFLTIMPGIKRPFARSDAEKRHGGSGEGRPNAEPSAAPLAAVESERSAGRTWRQQSASRRRGDVKRPWQAT
jgi:hypothetical protein